MVNSSKKIARRIAVSSGAAVAALALGAGSAFGAPLTYTVTAGSATAADSPVSWHASTTGSTPQVTFTDVDTGAVLNCQSASADGTIKVGSGLPGAAIGQIPGPPPADWVNCTGPGNLSLEVTGIGTWDLNATGQTVNGQTPGTITNIKAHVEDTAIGACSFDVVGSVKGYYDNSNHSLVLPGTDATLTITNTTLGCNFAGLAFDGDSATFEATYQVTADNPGFNPIEIHS